MLQTYQLKKDTICNSVDFVGKKINKIFISDYLNKSDDLKTIQSLKEINYENNYDSVLTHFINSIYTLNFPKKWRTEKIEPPNMYCKVTAEKIVEILYKIHYLIPFRIAPTIEEGIYIKYKNFDNRKILEIEIYNDNLDIAAIITKDKDIIMTIDIENDDFKEIIKIFND